MELKPYQAQAVQSAVTIFSNAKALLDDCQDAEGEAARRALAAQDGAIFDSGADGQRQNPGRRICRRPDERP